MASTLLLKSVVRYKLKLSYFAILAILAMGPIMTDYGYTQDLSAQNQVKEFNYISHELEALSKKIAAVTDEKKTVSEIFTLPIPAVKNYFTSKLPDYYGQLLELRNKIYENSKIDFIEGSTEQQIFTKDLTDYIGIYFKLVRVYIIASHNEGNNFANYLKYWPRLEAIRPKVHVYNHNLLMRVATTMKIVQTADDTFEVVTSEIQKQAFETEAMKDIRNLDQYAKAIQFMSLRAVINNHMALQDFNPKKFPDEIVNNCGQDQFFSFQTPANGNMLNSDAYLENKYMTFYNNYFKPHVVDFVQAIQHSSLLDPKIFEDYLNGLESLHGKDLKKQIERLIKDAKEDENIVETAYKDYEGFKKLYLEQEASGLSSWWDAQGQTELDMKIKPGEKLNREVMYEKIFDLAYAALANHLFYWYQLHFMDLRF